MLSANIILPQDVEEIKPGGRIDPRFTVGIGTAREAQSRFDPSKKDLFAKEVEQNITLSLAELQRMFSQHLVGKKDGRYVLQGRAELREGAEALHRTNETMRDLCLAGLDVDDTDLTFAEFAALLSSFGRVCFAYTTHSHGHPGKGNRYRVFFPLAETFDPTPKGAAIEWAERLRGLAEAIGIPHDEACKDPARLMYLPRHVEGMPHETWSLMDGDLLDLTRDVERVSRTAKARKANPFAAFAASVGGGDDDDELMRELRRAAALISDILDPVTWLDKNAPDNLTGETRPNGGQFTVCPHHMHEGHHSTSMAETPHGSYVVEPDPDNDTGFVWHCSHASCQDLDRLDRIACVIRHTEGVTVESLFDPDVLILREGDPEPEELLRTFKEGPSRAVATRDAAELTLGDAVEQVSDLTDPMDALRFVREVVAPSITFEDDGARGILFNTIKTRFKECTLPVLNKSYAQALKGVPRENDVTIPEGQEWRGELIPLEWGGEIIADRAAPCSHNVGVFLENHPELVGRVGMDEMRARPRILQPLPWDTDGDTYPRDWEDADTASLRCWLQSAEFLNVRREDVRDGFLAFVRRERFNPVKDYLNDLEWDGVKRLDTWLIDYCGAEDTPLNRAIGAKWMISAVARQGRPGCQAKYVLVLEGRQDAGKSKALAVLGGDWFTDDIKRLDDKDTGMIVQTNWIVELSELSGVRGKAVEEVKAFISRTEDEFRAPYASHSIKRPRRCVFAATTNERAYLFDKTGNVRFWPVKVADELDTDALTRDRDQLWAEAVERYAAGEKWWFDANQDAELTAQLRDAQAEREVEDPLLQKIAFHLTHEPPTEDAHGHPIQSWREVREDAYVERDEQWDGFTMADMLERLDVDFRSRRGGETRLGELLLNLGYEKRRDGGGARLNRYWLGCDAERLI